MTRTPIPPAPKADASPTSHQLEETERVRQWKYRLAQSLVFGLPVLALHFLGPRLGGPEAARWVGLFEALLSGWVLYVGAAGMIGDAVLGRRWTIHLVVALVSLAAYVIGIVHFVASLVDTKTPGLTRGFVVSTVLIGTWSVAALWRAGPKIYSE
jgi:hypothetical protein